MANSLPASKSAPPARRQLSPKLRRRVCADATLSVLVERLEQRLLMSSAYAITDLGTLGGNSSRGLGIHKRGRVVRQSAPGIGARTAAFLHSDRVMTQLPG